MRPFNTERLTRRDRRIAAVLLTDADDLTAPAIAKAAQVNIRRVFKVLDYLEFGGLIVGEFVDRTDGPRVRVYRLTRFGRAWAHRNTGLYPRWSVERVIEQEVASRG